MKYKTNQVKTIASRRYKVKYKTNQVKTIDRWAEMKEKTAYYIHRNHLILEIAKKYKEQKYKLKDVVDLIMKELKNITIYETSTDGTKTEKKLNLTPHIIRNIIKREGGGWRNINGTKNDILAR